MIFNGNGRLTIPGPGVDLSGYPWIIETNLKFNQFDCWQDLIQKGYQVSSIHDYRYQLNPQSNNYLGVMFDSQTDSTTDIINNSNTVLYNKTGYNLIKLHRKNKTDYTLTVNGVEYNFSSSVDIVQHSDRQSYFGTEDTEGLYYLYADVEFIRLKSSN